MHIGLFDSGVGGLTVLKELLKSFPTEQFSYLGDTARLPYGNKAPETLKKYTQENMKFLKSLGVDAIVVACHSASSVVLNKEQFEGIPVFNVITPACEQALFKTQNNMIGVMATKATIKSRVYPSYINQLAPKAEVLGQECPLLVPLVEENMIYDPITDMALERYLAPLKAAGTDTVLLGCTHYPILEDVIQKLYPGVQLINPAQAVAEKLKDFLQINLAEKKQVNVYLTDHAPHFISHAERLLGEHISYKIHDRS